MEREQEQTNSTTASEQNADSDVEIEEIPAVPKLSSYRTAILGMRDALKFIEQKTNLKTANELAEVISTAQTDSLHAVSAAST